MGDAACHLGSTCLNCGKFIGDELALQGQCPHCGAGPDGLADDDGLFGPEVSPSAANFILYCDSGRPPSSSIVIASGWNRRMPTTGSPSSGWRHRRLSASLMPLGQRSDRSAEPG